MFNPVKDAISRQGVCTEKYWTVTAVTDILKLMDGSYDNLFVDSVAACSVILPPVHEFPGRIFTITNKSGTSTLTVYTFKAGTAHDGAADSNIYNGSAAVASQALANAGAFTTLMSDGEKWIALAFDLSV